MLTFSFLMQIKQSDLRTADVYNLLNSIKNNNYVNIDNKSRPFFKKTADSSNFTTTLILFSTRLSHLQQSREHSFL